MTRTFGSFVSALQSIVAAVAMILMVVLSPIGLLIRWSLDNRRQALNAK